MKYPISVIVPTYKPGKYIYKCLNSLTTQDIDKQLFEVIIILNGCNEPYYTNINSFLNKELKEIKTTLIQTDIAGVSNARNIGLNTAKGEYIAFIDDDDWVSQNYLKNLLSKANSKGIVVSNIVQISEITNKQTPHFLTKAYNKAKNINKLTTFNSRSFFSTACCKLIPKSIISNDRFNTLLSLGEDAFFMFELSNKINMINLASVDTIYYVRGRCNSASRTKKTLYQRLNTAKKLFIAYTYTYFKNINKYEFLFFISRIVATFRNIFITKY